MSLIRVASVQMDVKRGDHAANLAKVTSHLHRLAEQGVQLAVFPECALTGYACSSLEDALGIALHGHQELRSIQEACDRLDIHAIVGYAQAEAQTVQNAATLFIPNAKPERYAKTHLPILGLDRFATRGDALPVFDTKLGRIGILICYDLRPPEAARVLALKGADLIAVPTNWPVGAEVSAEHVVFARSSENKVFLISSNRVGDEGGFHFIGRSKIISPTGRLLASAEDGEEVLTADLDLAEARQKHTVNIPGEYELEILGERHPDLYGPIQQPWNPDASQEQGR